MQISHGTIYPHRRWYNLLHSVVVWCRVVWCCSTRSQTTNHNCSANVRIKNAGSFEYELSDSKGGAWKSRRAAKHVGEFAWLVACVARFLESGNRSEMLDETSGEMVGDMVEGNWRSCHRSRRLHSLSNRELTSRFRIDHRSQLIYCNNWSIVALITPNVITGPD